MSRPRRSGSAGRKTRTPAPGTPLGVNPGAAAALREGRLALEDIEGQLSRLLLALRSGDGGVDVHAPDRLHAATVRADAAMAALADIRGA